MTAVQGTLQDRPAYRPYRARVAGIRSLSPHFTGVTFTGDDFGTFGTAGLDQRIKIMFPLPGVGLGEFGAGDTANPATPATTANPATPATTTTTDESGWYERWRALPSAMQNPLRTYTVRAIRPERREIDVHFVRHGGEGPAARWLGGAKTGHEVVIVGPDARSTISGMGLGWHPGQAQNLLLAGDETAVPAICSIVEGLPQGRRAWAFMEVPSAADILDLRLPDGCEVTWLPRGSAAHGARLDAAVRGWVACSSELLSPVVLSEIPPLGEVDVLWDSPQCPDEGDFYAWLAGENGVIKALRRHLVSERGIDRSRVAFMGYWRQGGAEAL